LYSPHSAHTATFTFGARQDQRLVLHLASVHLTRRTHHEQGVVEATPCVCRGLET
jgi:hypothetical protein